MRYRTLGGLAVLDGTGGPVDLGGPKQRAVLAVLLLELARPVPADAIAERVWGDRLPPSASTSLQAYVSNLRRALEPDRRPRAVPQVLVTRPAGYALVADRRAVDLTRFEDHAATGRALLDAGDASGAAAELDTALAECTGPLLPEIPDAPWIDDHRSRVEQLRAQVLEERFEAGLAVGEHRALIPRIEAAIADDPFREPLRAQLALALYRSGRQRDALAALHDARRVLVDEIGLDPGPELRRLEADILAQAPALDLTAPVRATARAVEAAPTAVGPVAPRAHPSTGPVFVGRERELTALLDAWARVEQGEGRPAIVAGEPGIGKTRLVEELVHRVDAVVAWGRCPESAAQRPYWPWVQVASRLDGAGVLREPLVVGEVADPGERASDPRADRAALQLAVARALATLSRPVVVVVDDAQWADPASLRLVESLAGELSHLPVLLVAVARPIGPDAPAPLVDALGELARQPGAVRVELAGLGEPEVARWLLARGATDPATASFVHDRTSGNPFFVGEVVELLAGEGDLDGAIGTRRSTLVPEAVHVAVRRRVGHLPAATQQLVATASIMGRAFDLDVLAEVSETAAVDVLAALDPAIAAGFLGEGGLPGRFEFSHALVADALAAESGASRRAAVHAATALALARSRSADLESHLPELAFHALAGAPAGTAERAYEWSVAAARHAAARRAHDDAAQHWSDAIRALELARPDDTRARAEAVVELGIAHLAVDDVGAGFAALAQGIDLALALDLDDLAASAAASMCLLGVWQTAEVEVPGVDVVGTLERVLARLEGERTTGAALSLAATVDAAYWRWPPDRLDAASAEAVEIARGLGDRALLVRTLSKRSQALWFSARQRERHRVGAELGAMAERGGLEPELEALARFTAASSLWDRGETAAARAEVERARALVTDRGNPALVTQLDFFLAAIAVVTGRLEEAEQLARRGHALYRVTRRWAADATLAGFLVAAWLDRDRLDDLRRVGPALLETPYRPWYKEAYGFALVEHGCLDEAARVCAELPPLTDSWLHGGVLPLAAHVRVALGDRAAVLALRDHLPPLSGRMANLGTGPAFGDVDLALASVHRFLGDEGAAARQVDASVSLLTRAGAEPFLARALLLRSELGGGSADRARAAEIVQRLTLAPLQRRLER